jgi:hypothetical protein
VNRLGFGSRIDSYYSTDLQTWINGTAFEIKNATEVGFSGIANNAVTRLDTPKGEPPAYVMSIESNGGPLVGKAFLMATFAYLNSSNLSSGWTQFPPATHHYTSHEYSACPTIRHFAGWFYVAVLFSPCCGNAPRYQQVLVRSRDLQTWSGPALPDLPNGPMNTTVANGPERTGNGTRWNPILCPLFDEANDRRVGPPAFNYNTTLTAEQYENIVVANDASNSDMDWSDDGQGGVFISYGWSNQVIFISCIMFQNGSLVEVQAAILTLLLLRGCLLRHHLNQESYANMFLAAAEVRNATQQEWLESFFVADTADDSSAVWPVTAHQKTDDHSTRAAKGHRCPAEWAATDSPSQPCSPLATPSPARDVMGSRARWSTPIPDVGSGCFTECASRSWQHYMNDSAVSAVMIGTDLNATEIGCLAHSLDKWAFIMHGMSFRSFNTSQLEHRTLQNLQCAQASGTVASMWKEFGGGAAGIPGCNSALKSDDRDGQMTPLLVGSYGSEGMLLQNSFGNLSSSFDLAATVAAFVATDQTLLGIFVDECAYYDMLIPVLQATSGTPIRVFGVLRSHNGDVYCPGAWGTNGSTTGGAMVNWTRVFTTLAAVSVQHQHFVAFTIDDFYAMMEDPFVPNPTVPMLPMAAISHAHRAMKAVAPAFLFLPTVYPGYLGAFAGASGFSLGNGYGQPFGTGSLASVSFQFGGGGGGSGLRVPVGTSNSSVGFWLASEFPKFARTKQQRASGWYDNRWRGVLFVRAVLVSGQRFSGPGRPNETLLDVDVFDLVTCSSSLATTKPLTTIKHCTASQMYVSAAIPGLVATVGELRLDLYAKRAGSRANADQSKMTTIHGVRFVVGGQRQRLSFPRFSTAGGYRIQAHDNAAASVATACDGLMFPFQQDAGATYSEPDFHALLSEAQQLTQRVGKKKLWALNYAWMNLGEPIGRETGENDPAFLRRMMRWEAAAGVDATLVYNLRLETGRLSSQSGIFARQHPPATALAAAAAEGGWGGVVAGFWPEHVPGYGGFFQSWLTRHPVSGNLSFGVNREWHATTTNESEAPFFFAGSIRVQAGPVLFRASTNVVPCDPPDNPPERQCPGIDAVAAAQLGVTCTVRCTPSFVDASRPTFPETVRIRIPPELPSPIRLVLEFSEVGGCGSWESVLMFATDGSTDDESLEYVAGLRDPQLVQLYDAGVASFAELSHPSPPALKPTAAHAKSDNESAALPARLPPPVAKMVCSKGYLEGEYLHIPGVTVPDGHGRYVANLTAAAALAHCEASRMCAGFTACSTQPVTGHPHAPAEDCNATEVRLNVQFKVACEDQGNSCGPLSGPDRNFKFITWRKLDVMPPAFACVDGQCTACPELQDDELCAELTYTNNTCSGLCSKRTDGNAG